MSSKGADPLAVIEAAYRIETHDALWLEGIVRAARPLLDEGLGLCGGLVEFDATRHPRPILAAPVYVGTPSGMAEGLERIVATEELASLQTKLFGSGKPISTASDELGVQVLKTNAAVLAGWGPLGIKDMLGVLAVDPGGSIVTLVVPQRKVVATTPARTETWARLSAHLAAAHRLRRWARNAELAEISSFADAAGVAEAVLTPDGRIQHAVAAAKPLIARAALRAAAVAIDRAKSARRRSPSQAVALWRALVEARWSLVDQFDRCLLYTSPSPRD